MYKPKINLEENKQEIVAFMKQFSFATIITSKKNICGNSFAIFGYNERLRGNTDLSLWQSK